MSFTNDKRTRYYGKRVGDIVTYPPYHVRQFEITHLDRSNNNRVYATDGNNENIPLVAEWCRIVTKVEDKK